MSNLPPQIDSMTPPFTPPTGIDGTDSGLGGSPEVTTGLLSRAARLGVFTLTLLSGVSLHVVADGATDGRLDGEIMVNHEQAVVPGDPWSSTSIKWFGDGGPALVFRDGGTFPANEEGIKVEFDGTTTVKADEYIRGLFDDDSQQ